jgi:two-component system, cell cycle response regulator DivK
MRWPVAADPILVVDDNPANRRLAQAVLDAVGREVHGVPDAETALAAVASLHPTLILMDIQLPGLDGLELTRRLKADPATRDIVILATTAYAMPGDERKAIEAGCDGYMTKPIDIHELREVVAKHLENAVPGDVIS